MSAERVDPQPPRLGRLDRWRGWRAPLLFLLKLGLAAALVGWLLRSDALDLGALGVLWRSPLLFGANLLCWLLCSVVLSTLRWRTLLALAEVHLPVTRAAGLQLMALFLNLAIPGNVGGDVLKALVVAREEPADKRTAILLVVVVERVLGLVGLVAAGAVATALGGPTLWHNAALRPTVSATAVLGAGLLLGPLVGLLVLRRWGPSLRRFTRGSSRLARLGDRVLRAIEMVVRRPAILAAGLLMSMAMHGLSMGYLTLLTGAITGQAVQYGAIATVFPLGLLTVVLPISPAGIGVGHMAFEQLYRSMGLSGGATIFNVFLIGQITPCLLGVLPFVALRRQRVAAIESTADPPFPRAETGAP
jgi:uncharacterized protein (TIRG00374 family)